MCSLYVLFSCALFMCSFNALFVFALFMPSFYALFLCAFYIHLFYPLFSCAILMCSFHKRLAILRMHKKYYCIQTNMADDKMDDVLKRLGLSITCKKVQLYFFTLMFSTTFKSIWLQSKNLWGKDVNWHCLLFICSRFS